MSVQPITIIDQPRADDLRAEARRLLRDGLSGYDIAVALNLDPDALRRLLGICEDCDE
jgi:hypothetical protein